MENLLKEEDEVIQRRREARAALEDCKTSVFLVSDRIWAMLLRKALAQGAS